MTAVGHRIALIVVVGRGGALLMQLRDADARVDPGRWTPPGGHLEPGESAEQAARRELTEETGLTAGEMLPLWHDTRVDRTAPDKLVEWHVFGTAVPADQNDVVLGEGQALEFVPPDKVLELGLTDIATRVLPRFLASPDYRRLADSLLDHGGNHRAPADPPARRTP